MTAWERRGPFWVKRDDTFAFGAASGGKARTCHYLATRAHVKGLVTATFRDSPQGNIVATVGQALGLPVRIHCPAGKDLGAELRMAESRGAELVQHRPGWGSVITSRAAADAAERGWFYVPFGMECEEAVAQTSAQVTEVPEGVRRIVVPVGSGMSLAGVIDGVLSRGLEVDVLGVVVGASGVEKRLDRYVPEWRAAWGISLERSELPYHGVPAERELFGLRLDGVYEAKALPFLREGDALWVIGRRETDGRSGA